MLEMVAIEASISLLLRLMTCSDPDQENSFSELGHFLARRFSDRIAAASSGVIVMGSDMVPFYLGGNGCQLAAIVAQVMGSGVKRSGQSMGPVVYPAVKGIQHRLRGGA